MQRLCILLVLASLTAVPLAGAAEPAHHASAAWRWALDHARYSSADAHAQAEAAIACAAGDIDGDGAFDLLLRARGEGGEELRALAGPDHTRVIWSAALGAHARLACAPDITGDGLADPLVELRDEAASRLPAVDGATATQQARAALHALDGATGKALVEIEAEESASGGGAGAASGSSRVDVTLEAGGRDLLLFVSKGTTSASAALPLEGIVLSSSDAEVRIEIIDAAGEAQGVIEAADGAKILAHASVVDDAGARVLVLASREASVVDQLPAQIPIVSAHALDGSLLWSTELDTTTQGLLLVPRAGDVDGDGVQDLVAQTVPADVDLEGATSLAVLSGADGRVLLARASEAGFVGALPLGDVTADVEGDAEALLLVTQPGLDAPIALECLREGVTCWSAQLPAGAMPVNGLADAFTGDLTGFHDLTGDGVPDVAALVSEKGDAALQVLSGVDGSVAWTAALDAAAHVQAVAGVDGADLAVLAAAEGALTLTLLDGAQGTTRWALAGDFGAGALDARLDDGLTLAEAEPLLLTVRETSGAEDAAEQVYLIDRQSGQTRWAAPTADGGAAPPALEVEEGEDGGGALAGVPAPGAAFAVGAVAAAALALRRRAKH